MRCRVVGALPYSTDCPTEAKKVWESGDDDLIVTFTGCEWHPSWTAHYSANRLSACCQNWGDPTMNKDVTEKDELGEPTVKKLVREWLVHQEYIPFPEFEVEGGRLDFLGVRWRDNGQRLDVVGVECKGLPNAADVWRITSEQLHRYARCVPQLYFACSTPSPETKAAFAGLCKLAQVGLLSADGSAIHETERPPEIGARFEPAAYVEQVRAALVLRLTFRAVFAHALEGLQPKLGRTWISTPEEQRKVQWNAVLDAGRRTAYLGVNIENATRVLAGTEANVLAVVLAGLPAEAVFWAGQDRYYAPRRRATLPLMETQANTVTADEIVYLRGLAARKGLSVHLTVGVPLWAHTETRHRGWYEDVMRATQGVLAPVREALTVAG